ncbi:MAG: c-type cytochrome [Chloroflexota bacterium]|nr:c-type cytochrome [Chloroflexota bacterium]
MTRNILIATIFTLFTTFLLGGIFIYESRRLPAATAAVTAEQIERGARDYEQYCATCHGLTGEGQLQYAAPQLNNIVQRYQESGQFEAENGIQAKYGTMRNFIEATLVAGRAGTPMPAFGASGTLRDDQIRNITSYVLSWNGQVPEAAQLIAGLYATDTVPTPDPLANPVSQGEQVFINKGCNACHRMDDQTQVGPGLGGLFQPGGTAAFGEVLPNNQPVTEENVRAWIQGGSAAFEENINDQQGNDYPVMPGFALMDEEWANLLVWLQAHNRDGSLTEEAQRIIDEAAQGAPVENPAAPSPQPTTPPANPVAPDQPQPTGPEGQPEASPASETP